MPTNKEHKQLLNLLILEEKNLSDIYARLSNELSSVFVRFKLAKGRGVWTNNPTVKEKLDVILKNYHSELLNHITAKTAGAWDLAERQNDDFVKGYIGKTPLKEEQSNLLFNRNNEALLAFQNRVSGGFTLSDRVWNLTTQTRGQMEAFLGEGLTEGRSAKNLAKDLKQYLKEPDKQFRRVRNKQTGKLMLSNPAKNYHPGRGVYRSSFKNALRLSRNEINIAYRTADHERRQKLPFVVGVKVNLSPAHPEYDICDELQGEYPKNFLFTGWHPNCLCFTTSKLLPRDQFKQYLKTGKIEKGAFTNTIPQNAANYIKNNSERLKSLSNTPYFLANNFKPTKTGYALKSGIGSLTAPKAPRVSKALPKAAPANKVAPKTEAFKPIKNIPQLDKFLADFAKTNPFYYARGYKYLKATASTTSNGYTRMNGDIYLRRNIIKEISAGINNIKQGIPTTLSQETAISTLHHEMLHNANIPGNMRLSNGQTKIMEMANEYVSRKRLPEFMQKLGGELQNPILTYDRTNTGYNHMVRNLDTITSALDCDKNLFLIDLEKTLINERYDHQYSNMILTIERHMKVKAPRALIVEFIGAATELEPNYFKTSYLGPKISNLLKAKKR